MKAGNFYIALAGEKDRARVLKIIREYMLTAFARSEDRTRALRAGFLVHVSKPVEPSELVATVASVSGRSGE